MRTVGARSARTGRPAAVRSASSSKTVSCSSCVRMRLVGVGLRVSVGIVVGVGLEVGVRQPALAAQAAIIAAKARACAHAAAAGGGVVGVVAVLTAARRAP